MKTNKYFMMIFFIFILIISFTSSGFGNEIEQSDLPIYDNGSVIDANGFNYSNQQDGLYKIISENSTTYFGFGISAKTPSNVSQKRTTLNFSWSYNKTNMSNGFNIIGNNNANNWITNFTFTNESTKITNTITNNFGFNLHDTKFYYIFSVNIGDNISYRDRNYQVQESSNIHLTNADLNLNTVATEIKKNNDFHFDYSDIILDGFNVTDIYLTDASTLGLGTGKIIAFRFTKNNGIFPNGATFTIDPKISNKKSYKSVQSNNPKFANNISSDVVFPTESKMKGKRLHISPVDKNNHANDVNIRIKNTVFNDIPTLEKDKYAVWQVHDDGSYTLLDVITVDRSSDVTIIKGGFSETVVGGVNGKNIVTYYNVSSGDELEICGGNLCNVTKIEVSHSKTANTTFTATINGSKVSHNGSIPSQYSFNISETGNVSSTCQLFNGSDGSRIAHKKESIIGNILTGFGNTTVQAESDYPLRFECNGIDGIEPSSNNTFGEYKTHTSNYMFVGLMAQDPSGTPALVDSSGNGNNGTEILGTDGAPFVSSDRVQMQYGYGVAFESANKQGINIGNDATLNKQSLTIIVDIKSNYTGTANIDNYISKAFAYSLGQKDSTLKNYNWGTSAGWQSGSANIADNVERTVAVTIDGSGTEQFNINGSADGGTDTYWVDHAEWQDHNAYIGGVSANDLEWLEGAIGYVAVIFGDVSDGYLSTISNNHRNPTVSGNNPYYDSISAISNIYTNVTIGAITTGNHNLTDGTFNESFTVQNINNITVYRNGYGTSTVRIESFIVDPLIQLTNVTKNGYIYGNSTYDPITNLTNVTIIIKKPTTTWDNEGTSTLTTNDNNATLASENATQWNISTAVNTSITLWYNATKPINHDPTGSVSNQGFTSLQNASIVVTSSDTDGASQLTCSATLDGTTINSCTSPIDFGIKAAGSYTIYWNGTDNNGTLSGTGTPFNETATITITQTTITPFGIRDGVYAIRNNSIPSNATILKNKNNSILTNVVTLNWSSITQNTWDEFLGSVNYSYTEGGRIGVRLNINGIYTDTDNQNRSKTNITNYFPDTKNDPFESDIQWIELNFTNTSESFADMGVSANDIAQNITEQTNNKFPIYTVQTATGLDSTYITGVSPIQYITITNITTFLDDEASTLRSSTSKSRVYSGNKTDTILSILSSYKTNIRNKLRGSISSSHPTETYAVHINNGSGGNDLILFNNQSTTQNKTVTNKTGIWLDTTNDVIKNYLTNTTLGFNISANSFGYIINEDVSKLVLNVSNAHDVYGESVTYNQTFTYGDNYNSNYVYAGTNTDLKTIMYDPSYRKTRSITDYGWINASLETNWSNYDVIILADKNWDELNDSVNNDDAVHGYIAVLDYIDSDAYIVAKKDEIDWWLSRGYGIFIDGIDFSISADNFSIRLKELVNHGRINYSESVILNTYTAYDQFSTFGDRVMKESCFARHNDDLGNIIYSMEDINLEKERADYLTSHNIPVICQAFGNATNYSKIRYTTLAWAVVYGDDGNNSFYYSQPDFQTSAQVRMQDFGDMIEPSYTETSSTDWNRLYSKGRVHINPLNQTGWVDDGKVINDMRLEFYTYSGGTGSGDRNVTFVLQTPDGTQYNFTDDNYEAVWAHRGFSIGTGAFVEHGYYPTFIKTRPIAGGWNFIGKTIDMDVGGISSYNDVSGANVPIEGNDSNYSWQSLGQDLHWMVRLNINYTVTQKIDTINNSYITQNQDRGTTGNTTVNLTTVYNYAVNIYTTGFTIITTNLENIWFKIFGGDWISANIPSSNTTDINATSITWTETVIDSKTFGVVIKYIGSDNWLVRALLPDSQSEIMVSGNVLPVLSNVSDKNVVEGGSVYIDIDATDSNSDTLTFSNNRTDLFSDFSTSTGQGNWTTNSTSEGVYTLNIGVTDGIGNTNTTMTVTVINGTVQNFVATPETDHVHLTWDAVSGASHYNISQLQDFIYFNTTGAVIDGLKDAPYNTTAIELMIDTPNPVISGQSDDFYIYYNATHLFMYLSGYDNDNKNNDDYMKVYLDLTADGLTSDDYAYKVGESGTTSRLKWSGSSWVVNPGTNANGTSTGAGTNNLTFEIEIPLSELSLSNNSNVKLLLERECTNLNPDVETFHPDVNINNTDNSLWLNQTLSPSLSWFEVGDTTSELIEISNLLQDEHYTMGINSTVGSVVSDRTTVSFFTTDNPNYNVSGYITNVSNGSINGTVVSISYLNGVTFGINVSDTNGYYKISHIHNGTYNLTVNATNYIVNYSQITINGTDLTNNYTLILENNTEPILASIGNKSVYETSLLSFVISATDNDSDTLNYTKDSSKGTLNSSTGVFSWTPEYWEQGVYEVIFNVSDGRDGYDNETVFITVYNTEPSVSGGGGGGGGGDGGLPTTPNVEMFERRDILIYVNEEGIANYVMNNLVESVIINGVRNVGYVTSQVSIYKSNPTDVSLVADVDVFKYFKVNIGTIKRNDEQYYFENPEIVIKVSKDLMKEKERIGVLGFIDSEWKDIRGREIVSDSQSYNFYKIYPNELSDFVVVLIGEEIVKDGTISITQEEINVKVDEVKEIVNRMDKETRLVVAVLLFVLVILIFMVKKKKVGVGE